MTMSSADVGTIQYRELAAAVRGDLVVPGDPGYDGARAVYNGIIDKHPVAIGTPPTSSVASGSLAAMSPRSPSAAAATAQPGSG